MKRILGLVVALAALALGTNVFAFTAGNIVIYRIGDGTQGLTNIGNTVYLDEYTTNPAYVGSTIMPTNWYGGNGPVIADGTAYSGGMVKLSQNGEFLIVTGYAATLGQTTNYSLISEFGTSQVARVVATVSSSGSINSLTVQTNKWADEGIRAGASTDGTNIWFAGDSLGIKYTTRGSLLATQVGNNPANVRNIGVYSNQLFESDGSGFIRVGYATNTFLPTVTNALYATLPGVYTNAGSPFGFCLLNVKGGATYDTIYIADGQTNYPGEGLGAVLKYSLVSGTWVNNGSIGAGSCYDVTGKVTVNGSHTNVTLFITNGGTASPNAHAQLYVGNDDSGFNADPSGSSDVSGDFNNHTFNLTPGGAGSTTINIRGVALAPSVAGNDSLIQNVASLNSVGPIFGFSTYGPSGGPFNRSNWVYSVANFGTGSMNVAINNQSGSLSWLSHQSATAVAGNGGSITVNVSLTPTAYTLVPGVYSGNVAFNASTGAGNVNRPAQLTIYGLSETPITDFNSSGPFGGPFAPANQPYTLSNLTASSINWGAVTATNWFTLSVTNGSLGGNASVVVTAAVNTAVANSLPVGPYSDTLTFLDVSHTNSLLAINLNLQIGFGFFDDFSTYADGNIVGQNSWNNTSAGTPLNIVGGVLTRSVTCPGAGQSEPWKNIATGLITNNATLKPNAYLGMLITVTSAPVTATPNYDFAMYNTLNGDTAGGGGFADDRVGIAAGDGAGTNFTLDCHISGIDVWQLGTQTFDLNKQYMVIIVGDIANSNVWVYVNPTDGDPTHLSSPVSHDGPGSPGYAGGGADPTLGSVLLGNYSSTFCQATYTMTKLAVSTNYTDVYTFLATAATPPPVASFSAAPTSGAAPLSVNFTDTSTGTPTSWAWDFGDTGTSASQNPTHTYVNPGSYTAQLIASNTGGSSTNTTTINVYDPFVWWQMTYSLTGPNSGGNASYTGDGMSNTNKFLAGFSPTSAASYLHVISIVKTGNDMKITYLGANGDNTWTPGIISRTNVLEFTTGTGNGSYSTNSFVSTGQTNILGGGTGIGVVTNSVDAGGATGATRYYRVRVVAP